MIVVAIIGLLAAIAIPQYTNYTQRTKVGSAVSAASSWKTAISLCVQDAGKTTGGVCGIPGTEGIPADVGPNTLSHINSVTTSGDGILTITTTAVSDANAPLVVTMAPTLTATGNLDWTLTGNGCTEPGRSIKCTKN